MSQETESSPTSCRRHTWPWFVFAAVILAGVLAFVWVRHEVRRLQWQQEVALPDSPPPPTNTTR